MNNQQRLPRSSTTALYIYGAQLYGTRYTLLYSESILDTLKTANAAPRKQPVFVAAEPGSQLPPNFECAAAALQGHLGGAVIGVRGSHGLTITPATLEVCEEGDAAPHTHAQRLVLRAKGQPLATVQRWRLLQSWRGGEFGCYEIPNHAVKLLFAASAANSQPRPATPKNDT